jgi:predicted lipoprotein with Yx(FWY)xxD motif
MSGRIRTIRSLVAVTALLVVMAGGCGKSSGKDTSSTAHGATAAPTLSEATTSAVVSSGGTKTAESAKLGKTVVTTADGFTLYTFKPDAAGGKAKCTDTCQNIWPPYPSADQQVVMKGWPLYQYAGDPAAGDTNGQGQGGVWFAMTPDGPSGP